MDNLRDQLANVSLYDVKAYVRKAQNAVLNFSDVEAKVREATNNEPWGTSTSVMQQIADATQSYQQFHEIMPFVYRRFTEKSASEWRQIYKALQLLDFLVKNGSERVVDYARSHTAVIDMLRHFHYIDRHGVDQGQGIRKRAEDLIGLLSSTERIRIERKKSRALNMKTGAGSLSSAGGGFGGSGKKYGGFGSEQLRQAKFGGGAAAGIYGGGAMDPSEYNGSSYDVRNGSDDEFEEYDAGPSATAPSAGPSRRAAEDIISFDNDNGAEKEDDDDFADFQSAPASAKPGPANTKDSILDLFSTPQPTSGPQIMAAPKQPQSSTINTNLFGLDSLSSVEQTPKVQQYQTPAPKKTDLFESLWESSKTQPTTSLSPKPAQQKPASTFQQPPQPTQPQQKAPTAPPPGAVDDLLML